jgi:hypothetical protein
MAPTNPSERVWVVPVGFVDENGQWIPDVNALTTGLLELQGLLFRVGGVMQIATRRQEVAPERIETTALVFRWRSFVPVDRSQEAPPRERDGTPEQAEAEPLIQPEELPADDEPVEVEAEEPAPSAA